MKVNYYIAKNKIYPCSLCAIPYIPERMSTQYIYKNNMYNHILSYFAKLSINIEVDNNVQDSLSKQTQFHSEAQCNASLEQRLDPHHHKKMFPNHKNDAKIQKQLLKSVI